MFNKIVCFHRLCWKLNEIGIHSLLGDMYFYYTYKYFVWIKAVLCTEISDPHHFVGSIGNRHPGHADPDRYQVVANEKCNNLTFFPKQICILSKKIKIMAHLILMRKIKHSKLAMLWLKVKKYSDFPTCVKLGVGSAWGSASFWCQSGSGSGSTGEIRIRIVNNMMPMHNTGQNKENIQISYICLLFYLFLFYDFKSLHFRLYISFFSTPLPRCALVLYSTLRVFLTIFTSSCYFL